MPRSRDEGLELAMDAKGAGWAIPLPGKRTFLELRAMASVPAYGVYELTAPVNVAKARELHLLLSVDAQDIGNQVSIVPEVSMDPAGADSSFFCIGASDGSVTVGDLGAAPGGTYTAHNFGAVTFSPLRLPTPISITAADQLRASYTIAVMGAHWIRFRVAEDNFVHASGTLTLAANVADTDTVTVGGKVYTFQTVLTNVDGHVQLGGNAAASIANLVAAFNRAAGSGVAYAAATTAHPSVTCTSSTATTLVVTAINAGTGGNAIATTETSGTASWGGATLSGGAGITNLSELSLAYALSV